MERWIEKYIEFAWKQERITFSVLADLSRIYTEAASIVALAIMRSRNSTTTTTGSGVLKCRMKSIWKQTDYNLATLKDDKHTVEIRHHQPASPSHAYSKSKPSLARNYIWRSFLCHFWFLFCFCGTITAKTVIHPYSHKVY